VRPGSGDLSRMAVITIENAPAVSDCLTPCASYARGTHRVRRTGSGGFQRRAGRKWPPSRSRRHRAPSTRARGRRPGQAWRQLRRRKGCEGGQRQMLQGGSRLGSARVTPKRETGPSYTLWRYSVASGVASPLAVTACWIVVDVHACWRSPTLPRQPSTPSARSSSFSRRPQTEPTAVAGRATAKEKRRASRYRWRM
jgi:hypothetical protein